MPIPFDAPQGEFPLTSTIPRVVLDTNVVLDWLLFADPSVAALAAAIERRQVRWLATPSMRDELTHVLERGLAAARGADTAAILSGWDAHAAKQPQAGPQALRCSDAEDQKFVDLALGVRARWLVSRDRAVLRLARRAAPMGTLIVTPQRWLPQ